MKKNSAAWVGANPAEQKRLNDLNKSLAAQIRTNERVYYNTQTGVWNIGDIPLYQKVFHAGGPVSSAAPLSNETTALLKNDEFVLTRKMQESLMALLKSSVPKFSIPNIISSGLSHIVSPIQKPQQIQVENNYTIYAQNSDDVVEKIKLHQREIGNIFAKQFT